MYKTVPVKDNYRYHPGNFQSIGTPGKYPNISDEQLKCMNTVQAALEKDGYWTRFCKHPSENLYLEPAFLKLVRFLRATNYNADASIELCKSDVEWREADNNEILYIRGKTCNEVLQIDYATEIHPFFPTWIQNYDKQGRPVCYRIFGNLKVSEVLKKVSLDNLVKFHIFETEMALRAADCSSKKLGFNIESLTIVVDAAEWGLHLATKDAIEFIKRMVATDNKYYPERMGQMLIINAPWSLSGVWAMISPILHPVTKAKIQIISKKSTWQSKLFEIVDKKNVPKMFGGTAADLTPLQMAMSFSTVGLDDADRVEMERHFTEQRKQLFPHIFENIPQEGEDNKNEKEEGDESDENDGADDVNVFRSRFKVDFDNYALDNAPITYNSMTSWLDRARNLGLFLDDDDIKSVRRRFGVSTRLYTPPPFFSNLWSFLCSVITDGAITEGSHIQVEIRPPVVLDNGDKYSGGWLDGKFEGEGELIKANGSVYEGTFCDGRFHGKGKYTFTNSKSFLGKYGNNYEGRFVNGEFEDVDGVLHLVGGVTYRGGFRKGLMHGHGKLVRTDGRVVVGHFEDDECNYGEVTYLNHVREHSISICEDPSGPDAEQTVSKIVVTYRGGLRFGLRHGEGKAFFADGTTLQGIFKNDVYQTRRKLLGDFLSKC